MSSSYDCGVATEREAGAGAAVEAVRRGDLIVLPTDTVYGVGADAFTPRAVSRLLSTKGRGRQLPVPVLIGSVRTLDGVAADPRPQSVHDLVEAFWPGPLTVVLRHAPSLSWDLGDSRGTVAVRMPLHPVALEVLGRTGPMAVSSANRSGSPPATTAAEARDQLGTAVSVYLDAGSSPGSEASTIVDLTGDAPRVLRHGALPLERLREVLPDVEGVDLEDGS